MSIITIIAYKANGYHSFRGHVSEQWESVNIYDEVARWLRAS